MILAITIILSSKNSDSNKDNNEDYNNHNNKHKRGKNDRENDFHDIKIRYVENLQKSTVFSMQIS